METQPIYLSSDESEINSPPSSPVPRPPDNIPDTHGAITQLIAAQHQQMSLSGSSAPQCPITPILVNHPIFTLAAGSKSVCGIKIESKENVISTDSHTGFQGVKIKRQQTKMFRL